jgi:hypothetical protein
MNELRKSIMLQLKNEKQQQRLDVKSDKNIKKQRKRAMKTELDGTLLRTIVIVPPFIIRLTLLAIRKEKILNWLSGENFNARHSKIGETHAEGTGTWLLDHLNPWFDGTGRRLVVCKGAGTRYLRTS